MKILFVSDSYYPHTNGVYYFVCRLAPALQERGHEVAVIAPSENLHATLQKIDGIDVYGMPSYPVLFYPGFRLPVPMGLSKRLQHLIKKISPDIIHVQDHFLLGKKVIEVSHDLNIPVLGTNHFMVENFTSFLKNGYYRKWLSRYMWKQFARVYNKIDLITTPTETGAELIRPMLKNVTIALSSGVDLHAFNPELKQPSIRTKYGIPSDKPVLLFVGRLDPEKRIEEIIRALSLAGDKLDCIFVIVGKGVMTGPLKKIVENLQLTSRVLFTGFVPDEDLPLLYTASDCFIIASIAELLSLATLQAMASGLPVIAVNKGALPELVKDHVNGFLFESGNLLQIAKCLQKIFNCEELRKKMGEQSIGISRLHDFRQTIKSFESLYARMILDKPMSTYVVDVLSMN